MKFVTGFVLFLLLFFSNCFLFPGKGKNNSSIAALLALLGGHAGSRFPSPGEPINLNGGSGPSTGTVIDVNGDGIPDGISTGTNGVPNIPLIDTNNDGEPDAVDANGDGVADYYLCYHSDGTITLTVGPSCSGNQVVVVPGTGYDEVGGTDNPIFGDIANDVTAPSSSINPSGGTFASAQTVMITCSDNIAPGNISYTTDGSTPTFQPVHGKIGGPPKVSFTVGQSGNGTYTIKFLCRDLAGNLQAVVQTATFTIDDHVPDVTNTSLSSDSVSTSSGAINSTSFNWSSNRDGNFTFRLGSTSCTDGSVIAGPSSVSNGASNPATINASDLAAGSNSVRICVVDSVSSLVGQKILTILRDDTAPSASTSPGAGDYSSTQNVLLSCTDSGAGCDKIVYTTDGSDPTIVGTTGAITNGTKYTTTIPTPDNATTQIKFIARDNAGNVSSVQSASFTVDSTVADITVNSSVSLISASSDSTFSWQSSKAGTYQFRIGGTDCSTGTALSNGGSNTNVSGTISAGGPDTSTTIQNSAFSDGANTVRICVSNLIGNFGSTTKTVTKDSTPPSISSTTPTDLSTGVAPNPGTLTLVFSEDMKTDQSAPTLTTNVYNVDGVSNTAVPTTNGTTFTWTDSKTLKIQLSWINFPENVKIDWTLTPTNLKDLAGNSMTIFATKKFTTTVRAKTRAVADTGLTTCYNTASSSQACSDSSWPRQDADFSNIPAARNFVGPTLHATFTSDATVKDNVTNLTWRNCTTGQSSGTGCSTGSVTTTSWYNSINACAVLNVANSGSGYAGITNWRLPSSDELDSLPDYSLNGNTTKFSTSLFPNVALSLYWTSTAYLATGSDRAYFINGSGLLGFGTKTTANRTLCVSE